MTHSTISEQARMLAAQCVNCKRLAECGAEKKLHVSEGANCGNFIGTIETEEKDV